MNERIAGALAELTQVAARRARSIEIGGTVEKSEQSNAALMAQVP